MVYIVAFGIVVSVIVFVHELGHFLAAKRSGVRVLTFSIGMGPKIFGIKRGDTEYILSSIPFGGYVRMAGDNPEEELQGQDWEFLSKPKRVRAFIVAAGPVMNLVLALVIFTGMYVIVGVEATPTREIGYVVEDTPAWNAGLSAGDQVLSLDGEEVGSWDDFEVGLQQRVGGKVTVDVLRGGMTVSTVLDLENVQAYYEAGMFAYRTTELGDVKWRGPAHRAGLRGGDVVVAIDGRPVKNWFELREIILASPGKELVIDFERDGELRSAAVMAGDRDGAGVVEVSYAVDYRRVGPIEAVERAFKTVGLAAEQIVIFFHRLLTLRASRDMIGGPVRIGEIAGESMRWGANYMLALIATISAQLALVNLLPIPVLDGGHLLLLAVEAVSRRPITTRQRIIAHQIGFVFLIGAILAITFIDVSRFIGR
jgi:regulator of sigma E protease